MFEGAGLAQLLQVVTASRLFLAVMNELIPLQTSAFSTTSASCQEIGLVALMFFFELLSSYVSLQFLSMFPLLTYSQSSFSLSADYPRHSRQRRSKILIKLIQEQSQISFYDLRISRDSQANHWIQW